MSVINQMLKDLAERSRPMPNAEILLSGLSTPPKPFKKNNGYKYIFLIIPLILISIAIFLRTNLWHTPQKLTAANTINSVDKITNVPLNTKDKDEFKFESSNLIDTSFSVNKETTSLKLILSHPILYKISQANNEEIIILLENTQLTKELVNIDTTASSLQKINMINEKGNLKVVLSLNPGAILKRLDLNKKDNGAELAIDFFSADANKTFLHDFSQNAAPTAPLNIKTISYEGNIVDEYQHAMNLSAQADNKEAIRLLTVLLEKKPKFIPARKSLASFLIKEGNLLQAEKILDTGLEQLPFYPPYVQLKSQILVEHHKIQEALSLLEVSPPPLEENPEYHAFMAALYQRANKSSLAEKLYQQLLTLQSHNSLWWVGFGIAEESLGKNAQALEAYNKAKETNTLTPELNTFAQQRINQLVEN